MASVGKNVTFDGDELRFEVNIFDFSQDIYGDTIRIFWLDKIREMVKFDGIDSLIAQLQSDERIARSWTGYRNSWKIYIFMTFGSNFQKNIVKPNKI